MAAMIAGIVAAQRVVAASVPETLWTPLNMATVPQLYLDAQDSTLTDVSGFCSAISNLGAMGSNGDFSQATEASRPAILAAELNGNRVLRFDGVNDVLIGGSLAQRQLLSNVGAGWYFAVVKKLSLDAPGTSNKGFFHLDTGNPGFPRFRVWLSGAGANQENRPFVQVRRLDADTSASLTAAASQGTVYRMQLVHVNFATGQGDIYIDGTLSISNPSLTTAGNTSSTTSSNFPCIGAVNVSGGSPADADLAAMILDRNPLSGADIDKLFGWAAHKYGLTANLPGGHPYKTTPPAA